MRAQLTLPEKPSALYLLAVLDIIAVLLILLKMNLEILSLEIFN